MTPADLADILTRFPHLCDNGMGIGHFGPRDPAGRRALFAKWRAELVDRLDECVLASWWMSGKAKTRTFSRFSSYGLKHVMEAETGIYVTNGEFIAGAIFAGFDVKEFSGSCNVTFNVSLKAIPKMHDIERRKRGRSDDELAAAFLAAHGHRNPGLVRRRDPANSAPISAPPA